MTDDVVVILTALDLEYQAVRERLVEPQLHRHRAGTRFEIGWLGERRCQVALGLVGKGNHPAAVLAERAIAEFDPIVVLFVGVAGALRGKLALGDVVVATHVYAYHGGTSEDDGLKARPRVWEIPHGPDQIARHVARTGAWVTQPATGGVTPHVHFGPIAAGEVVQDSTISDHARWVRQHYNDALAIEMEAAGVAQAGHLNGSPVVVVRGISDRADGTKTTTDGARWQPKAVANAAAFATTLALELVQETRISSSRTQAENRRNLTMSPTVSNTASGAAQVGVQAGQIHGDVWVAGATPVAPMDLPSQLAELREVLWWAHRSGQLDQPTYEAAETELSAADKALGDSRDGSRLLVALKRLRGLVGDIAELAAKVAAVIAVSRSSM
ncbi:5'-methylthioadenosine/S-adenosylhomocysteine nucleosidase [Micromonospora sp. WMMD882]|uniref:5'-methylthioadenosine/S-adenosylhomocysteine nucleosidase family protein n=1 Tax=Micromonospora sp. WMMD882 TaxID=3015151 RepID=UPI00248B7257|nr:5'-methylthioadenosine/S-adenosylhomocysteine nucleosidase [Micromonospora sp. WMMD882]WBB82111.1 5'-methylthioadenosine/S-adenosylhomocysteine nucleosidase [Micromonospora sp. WMMD882]